MEDKRVEIYVVYLDGKPISRKTGRKVAYLEPSGAKATVTVLATRYCEVFVKGYYGSSRADKNKLIQVQRERFEIRIFIDSDEEIC